MNPSPDEPEWGSGDGDTDMSGESSEGNSSSDNPSWGHNEKDDEELEANENKNNESTDN